MSAGSRRSGGFFFLLHLRSSKPQLRTVSSKQTSHTDPCGFGGLRSCSDDIFFTFHCGCHGSRPKPLSWRTEQGDSASGNRFGTLLNVNNFVGLSCGSGGRLNVLPHSGDERRPESSWVEKAQSWIFCCCSRCDPRRTSFWRLLINRLHNEEWYLVILNDHCLS